MLAASAPAPLVTLDYGHQFASRNQYGLQLQLTILSYKFYWNVTNCFVIKCLYFHFPLMHTLIPLYLAVNMAAYCMSYQYHTASAPHCFIIICYANDKNLLAILQILQFLGIIIYLELGFRAPRHFQWLLLCSLLSSEENNWDLAAQCSNILTNKQRCLLRLKPKLPEKHATILRRHVIHCQYKKKKH